MPNEPDETAEHLMIRLEDALALADRLSLPVAAIFIAEAIDHVAAARELPERWGSTP